MSKYGRFLKKSVFFTIEAYSKNDAIEQMKESFPKGNFKYLKNIERDPYGEINVYKFRIIKLIGKKPWKTSR